VVLHVRGGVPLVHDLYRVAAKVFLAGRRPLIGRIGDEVAKRAHGLGVRPDRRALQLPQRTQVPEPLINHRRRPLPRERVNVAGERPHRVLPALDSRAGQVARQLLVGEPRQHRHKHLVLRAQQRHPVHQMQARRTRHHPDRHHAHHPLSLAFNATKPHQMRQRWEPPGQPTFRATRQATDQPRNALLFTVKPEKTAARAPTPTPRRRH
jgi:hypothetical protein